MNAASLYISTCKLVMSYDEESARKSSKLIAQASETQNSMILHDLYRLIPYLNQCLSCVVCDQLLYDPHSARNSICQHYVCGTCVFGKRRSKSTCDSCRDCATYQKDAHLSTLVECFRQLCQCILTMPTLCGRIATAVNASDGTSLLEIVKNGALFKASPKPVAEIGLSRSVYSMLPSLYSPANSTKLKRRKTCDDSSSLISSAPVKVKKSVSLSSPNYTVFQVSEGNSTKITIKRNSPEQSEAVVPVSQPEYLVNLGNLKTSCRCGLATALPGKLTCCGQRCACYIDQKPCTSCKCKGCRNPYNGGKRSMAAEDCSTSVMTEIKKAYPMKHVLLKKAASNVQMRDIISVNPRKVHKPTNYCFNDSAASTSPYSSPEYTYSPGGSSNLLLEHIEQFPTALLVDDEVYATTLDS